jgi:hypothetical protein
MGATDSENFPDASLASLATLERRQVIHHPPTSSAAAIPAQQDGEAMLISRSDVTAPRSTRAAVRSRSAPAACVIEGARQTAPHTARAHAGDLGLGEVPAARKNAAWARSTGVSAAAARLEECTRVRQPDECGARVRGRRVAHVSGTNARRRAPRQVPGSTTKLPAGLATLQKRARMCARGERTAAQSVICLRLQGRGRAEGG